MAEREYTIYTLNAFELMKICRIGNRQVDLTSAYDRDRVLLYDGKYGESELNSQIMRVLYDHTGGKAVPDDVTESLVYLNFGKGLNDDFEEDTKKLLEEGFSLRFSSHGRYISFVPFD